MPRALFILSFSSIVVLLQDCSLSNQQSQQVQQIGDALLECKGDFQVTKYGLLATPYCEEENIAIVAQSYGWQVTGSQVRKNPLKKVYICQVLGRDIRLKGSCAGYSPDAYAPGR